MSDVCLYFTFLHYASTISKLETRISTEQLFFSAEVALPRTPQISYVAIRTEHRLVEYGPIFSYSMLIYKKETSTWTGCCKIINIFLAWHVNAFPVIKVWFHKE